MASRIGSSVPFGMGQLMIVNVCLSDVPAAVDSSLCGDRSHLQGLSQLRSLLDQCQQPLRIARRSAMQSEAQIGTGRSNRCVLLCLVGRTTTLIWRVVSNHLSTYVLHRSTWFSHLIHFPQYLGWMTLSYGAHSQRGPIYVPTQDDGCWAHRIFYSLIRESTEIASSNSSFLTRTPARKCFLCSLS